MQPHMRAHAFSQRVLAWYDKFGRKTLPWQYQLSPYRVWVSEIMLQQTQVATVIPYFERFIKRYPNAKTLAKSSTDEVLHYWTGLGYYSRARHLHHAAQIIVNEHAGKFPENYDEILALPGIGRSTAGAICAISLSQRHAILDGNVKRVLARFQAVAGWPNQPQVHELLWQYADHYTPTKRVRDYTQAMMDLGALICTQRQPDCQNCPLSDRCLAFKNNEINQYPGKKPPKVKPIKQSYFLIFKSKRNQFYLRLRPSHGIWGGLYGFPECLVSDDLVAYAESELGIALKKWQNLPSFRHTFTHFHLDLQPILIDHDAKQQKLNMQNALWYDPLDPPSVGISAPVKKILQSLKGTT